MMRDFVTVVTGSPRSGSSLMLRMLFHGGIPVLADNHISFESVGLHRDMAAERWQWLDRAHGMAFKLLDPQTQNGLPAGHAYRFIHMTRNTREQATSFVKFNNAISPEPLKEEVIPAIAASIKRDEPLVRAYCARGTYLNVRFEDVITRPQDVAARVAAFLGPPLDEASMARQVVERSPQCLPYLLEARLVEEEERRRRLRR